MQNKRINKYVKKWFAFYKSRRSESILAIMLFLSFLCFILADFPEHKLDANLENNYKINAFSVIADKDEYFELKKMLKNGECIFEYYDVIPKQKMVNGVYSDESTEYLTDIFLLPQEQKRIKIDNPILFGEYYTKEKQILVTYQMACELTGNSPQNAVGMHINYNLYKLGDVEFEISGVLRELNSKDLTYFTSMGIMLFDQSYDGMKETFFMNGGIMEEYVDELCKKDGETSFLLSFDDYYSMKSFYETQKDVIESKGGKILFPEFLELKSLFETLFILLFPISITMGIFTIVAYLYEMRLKIKYDKSVFFTLEYAGFSYKEITHSFVKNEMFHITKITFIAIAAATGLSFLINFLNSKWEFAEFQIFTFNYGIPVYVAILIIVELLLSQLILGTLKKKNWYVLQREQRDIL